MHKDFKVSRMFTMLRDGCSVAETARKLPMSEKTVRKYRDKSLLPSQIQRPRRDYRTRLDPLDRFWPEIEKLLEADRRLKPYALLQWLQQKYNSPGSEATQQVVPDSLRRTLERRVQRWKLHHDVGQEVIFPQIHHPADVMAFDFVDLNCLQVTIAGKQFDHKLFHAVLTFSNWEHLHLCHSESYEALATGLQDALYLAGGVPQRVRSDSLSAAVNNLSSDKEFAKQYQGLLNHYGLKGHRINVRKPQENGDVESSNGHIKTAIDQSLRLRGNRDFASDAEYRAFVLEVVTARNAKRQVKLLEEIARFTPLPQQRVATFTCLDLHVTSDCVVRIKRNSYSVSSKYINLRMEVRIHQDNIELWYSGERVEIMPRLYGKDKEAIDFRHVIDSLVRKPGAFVNYKYQAHMFPTTRFRMAYDMLLKNTTEASAIKQYLKILHAAKHEGLDTVDDILRWILSTGNTLSAQTVLNMIASQQQLPSPTDLNVEPPALMEFDFFLPHKDVYDDQESSSPNEFLAQLGITAAEDAGADLSRYDEHLTLAGAIEGSASADDSRAALPDGRAGGTGPMDSLAILVGTGDEGMRVAESESDRAIVEGFPLVSGQDLGPVSMVAAALACDAAVRDLARRQLPGSTRQLVDIWETGIREDESPIGPGRPTGAARSVGVVYNLPDAGSRTAAVQTGSTDGAVDQVAEQVRGVDHRRSGLCATEPGGDGGPVHAVVGALRARQCVAEQQLTILEVGTDLQGSDDDSGGDRSLDPSFGDHRVDERQLSIGCGQSQINTAFRWLQDCGASILRISYAKEF